LLLSAIFFISLASKEEEEGKLRRVLAEMDWRPEGQVQQGRRDGLAWASGPSGPFVEVGSFGPSGASGASGASVPLAAFGEPAAFGGLEPIVGSAV